MRELSLNGYIDDDVYFGDEITPELLHDMLYEPGPNQYDDVHIKLNSYGGSCNAAVRMHDELVDYPGRVFITISGTAASAATVLAMAADQLEMTSGSLYMIHDPSMLAVGNEQDMLDAVALLHACKESIIRVYQKRCRMGHDAIAEMMSATTWMDAQAAVNNGFIDKVSAGSNNGIYNAIVDRATAERMVDNWTRRHKGKKPEHTEFVPAALKEAEKPVIPENDKTGIPISQLYKRLALIMPKERGGK